LYNARGVICVAADATAATPVTHIICLTLPVSTVKGMPILRRFVSRYWIALVILAVVAVGGVIVDRVHGYFGSGKRESYADASLGNPKPFNPTRITYEVFGPAGTVADISYFDVNVEAKRVEGAELPWSLVVTTDKLTLVGNLVARGNSDSIGCRITVDGVVTAERVSDGVDAYTYCPVKSA